MSPHRGAASSGRPALSSSASIMASMLMLVGFCRGGNCQMCPCTGPPVWRLEGRGDQVNDSLSHPRQCREIALSPPARLRRGRMTVVGKSQCSMWLELAGQDWAASSPPMARTEEGLRQEAGPNTPVTAISPGYVGSEFGGIYPDPELRKPATGRSPATDRPGRMQGGGRGGASRAWTDGCCAATVGEHVRFTGPFL